MASSEQPPQMPPSMQASPPPPTYAQQQRAPTADANPSQGVATSNVDAYLLPRLRAQIEFYFSPQNLARDNYLRSVLYHYGGAAAPLSVIAAFPKVRDLVATTLGTPNAPADPSLLMRALEGSSIVAVSPDAMWISPLLPMPPMDPTNTRQFMPQNLHPTNTATTTTQHMTSASPTSQSSQSSVTETQPQQVTPNLSDEQQNSTDGTKSERKSEASPAATPPSSNSKGSVTPSPSDIKTSSSPQKSESGQADQQQMPPAPPNQHGRNVQLPSAQYQVAPTMTHMTPPHGPQPIPTGLPGAPTGPYAAYPYNYRHYTPVAVPNPHQYPNAATYQHIPANMQQSANPQPLQYAPQLYPPGYPYVQVQGMQGMNRYYGAGPYRSDSGGRAGANMPMTENGQARQYSNGSHHAKNRQQVDNPKQLRKNKLKKGFGSNQQIVDSNGNIIAQRWRGNGIGPNIDGNGYTENDSAAAGKGGDKANYNNRNRYDNMARHRSQSELSEVSGVDSTGDSKYSKKKKKNKKRDGGYNDSYRSNDKKESTKPDYSFDSSSFPALSPAKDKEGTEDMKQPPQVTAFSGYADALRQANKVKASGTKLDDSSSHVASMSNGEQLEEINEGVATMNITNETNEKTGSNEGVSGGPTESIATLETTESTPDVTPEVKDVKAPKVESEAKQAEGTHQTTNGIAETTTQSVDTKESAISKEMVPNIETGNSLGDHGKPAASPHEASLPVTPVAIVTDESKDEVQTTAVPTEAPQSTWGNKRSFIDVVMKQP